MSLGEVVSVTNCSEPGCPRLAVHTLRSAATHTVPLRLQFSGDTDLNDWLANLTSGKSALDQFVTKQLQT